MTEALNLPQCASGSWDQLAEKLVMPNIRPVETASAKKRGIYAIGICLTITWSLRMGR
jgi:hypothetical protein